VVLLHLENDGLHHAVVQIVLNWISGYGIKKPTIILHCKLIP